MSEPRLSGATVAVTGGGSGTGISALINGTVDLANASRAMKDDEILRGLPVRIVGSEPMDGYPKVYRHRIVELVLQEGSPR